MKKIKNSIYRNAIMAFATVVTLASCDSYLDVNEDPNNPSSENIKPENVLAASQVYTYSTFSTNMNQLGNLMMNNWTRDVGASNSSYYFNEHTYNVTSDFYSGIFENLMLRTSNFTFIINSEEPNYEYYKAISKILKAKYFQYLVDLYGDIPYTEAHKRGQNLTPAYDDDMAIYRNLVVQLEQAVSLIDNAPSSAINPGANDVILQGNMAMWKKLANTLKLKILIRESQKASSAAYVQSEMQELVAANAQFLGPNDNIRINPGFNNNKPNAFASLFLDSTGAFLNNWSSTAATKYTITYLTNTNDGRRNRIYSAASNGTYAGHQQGDVLNASTNYPVSHVGTGLLTSNAQDGIIFTAAESLFLQAEAVQRNLLPGVAKNLYESGITESYKFFGLSAADATAYYNQAISLVNWNASTGNEIEAIINQKWIALNGINGIETWIENTRTGFPAHVPLSTVAPGTSRPVRLLYPSSEISGNTANVPAQNESQAFTSRVFWNL
ncbi:SusD/RagB family nutrient-binding outer membrane lipoprotein [Flavobacterium difficile]|uniref:SusD/RagB family nutrient-binding outer membrane lipoprotein n=1 Tax=Flavobacterium difficile TaxID=2709659 RepID=A0ABX0I8X8_9FLAO|nr:SusD/RagB family nutrient-binding outer membrane lipoprotein [Flavobacterium difficile]NHM01906.1 SusD/RagB family nutrient-binding outer membrane lipoprotein [Flavobacterium difficile]